MALFLAIHDDYDLLLWYIDNANEGSHDRFLHRLCIACQINPAILFKVKNKNFRMFAKNPQNRLGFLSIEYAIVAKDFTLIQMLKNIGCEPYYVYAFEYLFIRMVVACNYSLSSLKEVLKRMGIDINKPTINKETQMDIAKKYNDQTYIQALSYLNDSIALIDEKNWDSKFALRRE